MTYDPIDKLSNDAKAKIFDQIYSLARSALKIAGAGAVTHGIFSQNTELTLIGVAGVLSGLIASAATHK